MTRSCVLCGDHVPPAAGDHVRFCGACLVRPGPPIPSEPRAELAAAIVALREHVMRDVLPEGQLRPKYLTSSSNSNSNNQEIDK